MRRREFIEGLASAAALPSTAGAQQHTVPVVGFLHQQTAESAADLVTAFRAGLEATGFVEGRNVVIEYRWDVDAVDLHHHDVEPGQIGAHPFLHACSRQRHEVP
jgi:hypothetical protein